MTELIYLDDITHDENTVLTVGTFDGVHEGHKSLISRVVVAAKKSNCRCIIVSFDPHPREVIQGSSYKIRLLTTLEERRQLLSELGVDILLVIPFDREFSLLTSQEFINDVIHKKIGVKEFIIGYDHQFGRNREGTIETVKKSGVELGFEVDVVEAHEIAEVTVSSTSVRNALEKDGNVDIAREFLGRPYRLTGMVTHGDKRGRTIGYPTANIHPEHPKKIIPANGVYAVNVCINDKKYRGMMNIGVRPTVSGEKERRIEVNIFDFDANLYGYSITVEFIKWIREEKKFNSLDELKCQLAVDKQNCLIQE